MERAYGTEARKARWAAALEPDAPAQHLFVVEWAVDLPDRPLLWPANRDARIEWAWRKYNQLVDRVEWLPDDRVPYLDMLTGTEIFAEALGANVFRPENEMPCAIPFIKEPADVARVRAPDLESSSLAYLFEMADTLRERAPGALLRLPDIQSPMDIAATMWDKQYFFTALLTDPEAVRALCAKAHALLTAFLDTWFVRYGRDFIAHYPDYYMPYGLSLSEDEVGAVSPEHFEAFFLPELEDLAMRYGRIGMHCCARSIHQWDGFARIPNLVLLNLSGPVDTLRTAYTHFGASLLHHHAWCWEGPCWTWPAQTPPGTRAVHICPAESREEAVATGERMAAACGRPA